MSDKCPFCGAEKGEGILVTERTLIPMPHLVWFECGTILNQGRGSKCYECQVAKLQDAFADAEKIIDAVASQEGMFYFDVAQDTQKRAKEWIATYCRVPISFRSQYEPADEGEPD